MAIPDYIKSDAANAAADQSVFAGGASRADHGDGDLAAGPSSLMLCVRMEG